jgi:hypothetical protein
MYLSPASQERSMFLTISPFVRRGIPKTQVVINSLYALLCQDFLTKLQEASASAVSQLIVGDGKEIDRRRSESLAQKCIRPVVDVFC